MKPGLIVAEIVAWIVFFPIAIVMMIGRQLGYGWRTDDDKVDALLQWYPAPWRARHGERFTELLRDTMGGGHDDLRSRLDVAREGMIERRREFSWQRAWASLLLTVGWIMVLPQGILAPILGVLGVPNTWFVALYFEGAERWLIAGAMFAVGVLLIDRGIRSYAPASREATTG
jgi:hypothetical protein